MNHSTVLFAIMSIIVDRPDRRRSAAPPNLQVNRHVIKSNPQRRRQSMRRLLANRLPGAQRQSTRPT
ncbi:hypothetical protein HMPREF9568_00808 [Cutibacterium acnes HL013PA2]|nr:hypothetical protein HMPREF9568_00808 [Cutibacterium acnes HL013PA2]